MTSVPDHIQIKLQHAKELSLKIMEICFGQLESANEKQLKTISVYLGTMAQTLRSALNNAMWDFAESNLKSMLSEAEYDKVHWSHDFPIERDKDSFTSKSRIVRHIVAEFESIYHFLEKAQPYNSESEFLWILKLLSNDTNHNIPIEVNYLNLNDVSFAGSKPHIIGNKVIIHQAKGLSVVYSIPCFIKELNMFVSKEKKWVLFLINVGGPKKPSLTVFVEMANSKVNELVSEFYDLW